MLLVESSGCGGMLSEGLLAINVLLVYCDWLHRAGLVSIVEVTSQVRLVHSVHSAFTAQEWLQAERLLEDIWHRRVVKIFLFQRA